jgi:carbamoyl-phosphate synthase large subunit
MLKKIFVSGASGVIGSELIPLLLEKGYDVYAGDLKPCPAEWIDKVHYYHGDLNEMPKFLWDSISPDVFIHLAAAFERTEESKEFWDQSFNNNTKLSYYLMSLAVANSKTKKIIYASSYLAYDKSQYLFDTKPDRPRLLKETDYLESRNLIGNAKLSHEAEIRYLSQQYPEKEFIVARIYRGYGRGSKDVISRWVRSLLKGEEVDLYRPEGIFDYIYAKDSAEGLLRLFEAGYKGIINLGTGKPKAVNDVVACLKVHFPGSKFNLLEGGVGFEASGADTALLEKTLKWTPPHSIESAIPLIIEHERKTMEDYVIPFGNVLITSVSEKVPLVQAVKVAAKKIDSEIKVIGGDILEGVIGSYFVDKFIKLDRLVDSVEYFHYFLKVCKAHNVSTIIPTRDAELSFFSKFKTNFKEQKISVMVPDIDTVNIVLDKAYFYEELTRLGYKVIPTYTSIDPVLSEARVVVKERYGAGSRNMLIDVDPRTLNASIVKNLKAAVYQPFIKGVEFSIDVFVSESGKFIKSCVRQRNTVVSGESQITTEVRDLEFASLAEKLVLDLKLCGHSVLQAIKNDEGIHFIECNARFGGASTLGVKAGVDSFHYFLYEQYFKNLFTPIAKRDDLLLKQVRFKNDLIIEFIQ